jgi:hypothetical protein
MIHLAIVERIGRCVQAQGNHEVLAIHCCGSVNL